MSSSGYFRLSKNGAEYWSQSSNNNKSQIHDDQVSLISSLTSPAQQPGEEESFDSFVHHSFFQTDVIQHGGSPTITDSTPPLRNHSSISSDPINLGYEESPSFSQPKIRRKPVPALTSHGGPSLSASSVQYHEETSPANIEMISSPQNTAMGSPKKTAIIPAKEWIPVMLRKGPAMLLFLTCWSVALLLESLDIMARNQQGFSTKNVSVVYVLRYVPTIIVIGIGLAWKSFVWDLKMITPYSVMSNNISEAKNSMLLDYIDPLEVVSLWKSIQNRHWAVTLGLFAGLLSGTLVPLANSLTIVNLYSPVNKVVAININSQFSLQNALANNYTLTIPWDYRGNQPYAAVVSSRQPNGKNAPWTVDEFAFESFNIKPWLNDNATISATVQAVNAPFECSRISYTVLDSPFGLNYLEANDDDLIAAGCRSSLQQSLSSIDARQFGWLNVTDCSDNGSDIRMLATALDVPSRIENATDSKASGLLCRPRYFSQEAKISVNGSTGDVIGFTLSDKAPKPIDIGVDIPVIVTYLNNPLDERSQEAFILHPQGPYTSIVEPQATLENVTYYAGRYINRDVFFNELFVSGRTASEYISDPSLLEAEVLALTNTILTQVLNSFGRSGVSVSTSGFITLHQSRLLIRDASLRSMQSILAVMGIICCLCCTYFRPKTCLTEDPSSIAATSVILSASGKGTEEKIQEIANLNTTSTEESLRSWRWVLACSQNGTCTVEGSKVDTQHSHCKINLTSFRKFNHEKELPLSPVSDNSRELGYRPFAFRLFSRLMLVGCVTITIITLSILLKISSATGGFEIETLTSSAVWSLVPTTVLVLVGYCISSVHCVLQTLTPYLALHQHFKPRTLLFAANSSVFMMPAHAILRFGSIILAISSLMALAFPAVKILGAGLYVPTGSSRIQSAQVKLDTSLPDRFETLYEIFPTSSFVEEAFITPENERFQKAMVLRASQISEWSSIPYFGFPHRSGAVENLVFSNLTIMKEADQGSIFEAADHINLRLPAIAVNVTCIPFEAKHFRVMVQELESGYENFRFSLSCATKQCNDTFGYIDLWWIKSNFPGSTSKPFQGRAMVVDHFKLSNVSLFDTPYQVVLGDFSSIREPFQVQTLALNSTQVTLEPGMFNFSRSPFMVAASCTKALWKVEVEAELTRGVKSGVNGTTILPWAVSSYNKSSIVYKRQYKSQTPLWAYPKHTPKNQYNDDTDSLIDSDTLWPLPARSTNIFELLATYQEFQVRNLSGLLDHKQLASAIQTTYTSYLVEMLTELRPHAAINATDNETMITSATFSIHLTRMKQNAQITIILCILLFFILSGLICIFWSFPREGLMAKPPTSIIAQMSFIAGSKFVGHLRNHNVQSVIDTNIWQHKFRFGWWPVRDSVGVAKGQRRGIDIIQDEQILIPNYE